MHIYPQNAIVLDHNIKLHKIIEMHSKYDNMHTNRNFLILYIELIICKFM